MLLTRILTGLISSFHVLSEYFERLCFYQKIIYVKSLENNSEGFLIHNMAKTLNNLCLFRKNSNMFLNMQFFPFYADVSNPSLKNK